MESIDNQNIGSQNPLCFIVCTWIHYEESNEDEHLIFTSTKKKY